MVGKALDIPVGRVALLLHGETVMLGLDVDDTFNAALAQEKAAGSFLKFTILGGKLVSGKSMKF